MDWNSLRDNPCTCPTLGFSCWFPYKTKQKGRRHPFVAATHSAAQAERLCRLNPIYQAGWDLILDNPPRSDGLFCEDWDKPAILGASLSLAIRAELVQVIQAYGARIMLCFPLVGFLLNNPPRYSDSTRRQADLSSAPNFFSVSFEVIVWRVKKKPTWACAFVEGTRYMHG